MFNAKKSNFLKVALLMSFVVACKPAGSNYPNNVAGITNTQENTNEPEVVLEQDLTPTWEEPTEPRADGIIYEQPKKKIKNPQAEIIAGQLKMAGVKMNYNTRDRKLEIYGVALVLDENKKEIANSDFNLYGGHAKDENVFSLKPNQLLRANSDEKPIVRAKATCLDIDANDNYDCSRVVVDFFVAYKKQVYTQQMEVVQKPKLNRKDDVKPTPPPIVAEEPADADDDDKDVKEVVVVPASPNDKTEAEAKNILREGQEKSIPGPYQGSTGTANLAEIFSDDEAQVIKKPEAKPESPKAPLATDPKTQPKVDPKANTPVAKTETKPEPKKVEPAPVKPPASVPLAPLPAPAKPADPKTVPPTKPKASEPQPVKPEPAKPVTQPKTTVPVDKDKSVTKDFKQTESGDIRPINQAIGFVDKGSLRNATSVLTKQQSLPTAYFEVRTPGNNNHFATYEMAEMINRLGTRMNQTVTRKLYVGSVSLKNGGKISPHQSHQIGVDADLGYPTLLDGIKFPVVAVNELVTPATESSKAKVVTKFYPSRFSVEKTYDLFKFAFSQPDIKVERIFADRTIKKALCDYAIAKGEFKGADKELVQDMFESIEHVAGHGNHFHLRIRCSAEDPACRPKLYVKNNGCR